jgi:hypothetical protein
VDERVETAVRHELCEDQSASSLPEQISGVPVTIEN